MQVPELCILFSFVFSPPSHLHLTPSPRPHHRARSVYPPVRARIPPRHNPCDKNADRVLRYIDTAAQHAANKGRGTGGGGDGSVAGERSSPVYLPESLSQAIYVPTQKITTLHPGVGAVAVAVATALASGQAISGDGRREGGGGGDEGGEDDIDLRLSSAALSATPALLQSVTGKGSFFSRGRG